MGLLKKDLNALHNKILARVEKLVGKKGRNTGMSIERGIRVRGDFYVGGRKISHITVEKLIAEGLHFQYQCMPVNELVELVESLK